MEEIKELLVAVEIHTIAELTHVAAAVAAGMVAAAEKMFHPLGVEDQAIQVVYQMVIWKMVYVKVMVLLVSHLFHNLNKTVPDCINNL